MNDDIKLPPLPTIDVMGKSKPQAWFTALEVDDLRRAAIEADRQRRVEPTAAEISDVIREITGCPDIKNGGASLVVALGMLFHRCAAPQPAEQDEERLAMEAVMESVDPATWPGLTVAQRCALSRFAKPQPAEPVKRKRRYAQGTALGEYGVIPMCDQVDDEPVKVPSDEEIEETLNLESFVDRRIADDEMVLVSMGRIRAAFSRYGQPAQPATSDYEEVLADHRRLVRKLDVLLNGEEGAAKQASLCDIVAQVQREGIKAAQPAASAEPVVTTRHDALVQILREAARILEAIPAGQEPACMRFPIIDELEGFAFAFEHAATPAAKEVS